MNSNFLVLALVVFSFPSFSKAANYNYRKYSPCVRVSFTDRFERTEVLYLENQIEDLTSIDIRTRVKKLENGNVLVTGGGANLQGYTGYLLTDFDVEISPVATEKSICDQLRKLTMPTRFGDTVYDLEKKTRRFTPNHGPVAEFALTVDHALGKFFSDFAANPEFRP
jgi:hypothetical protein